MFEKIVKVLDTIVWQTGIPVGDETIPFIVIALLGTGVFVTLRLGFPQIRRLAHGFAVTSGKYDDPSEPGDVSHFQALTTALSATVGIGNIAGVAAAIHWGGPGALFWMWMTAFFGMAIKFSEVTLAQKYRQTEERDEHAWRGTVSGGPMYYIEHGLGKRWKPVAMFFAFALMCTSFLTGNAVQANTVADTLLDEFGIATWISGLVAAILVGLVIIGGIKRIGAVTGVLAPVMASVYVLGAMTILALNYDKVVPTFGLIFREAFNPTAGVAGTGVGAFLVTVMWGVRRGLFSNEAGQGSAPIAHAAAQTDEPVSEGVVALLEPFVDTLVICTMTGLVILITGVWSERVPTAIDLGGDVSYVRVDENGSMGAADTPQEIRVTDGYQAAGAVQLAWHEVAIERLYVDEEREEPFTGTLYPGEERAESASGGEPRLWALAVESGAPLTKLAFQKGLSIFGAWGGLIVLLSVLLFALSTAISWSYYGDRCANYLFGPKAILPYKIAFCVAHFSGATLKLATVWAMGDIFLGIVTFPNLIALLVLSGMVVKMTNSYFERRPWVENAAAHRRWKEERRLKG